MHTAYAIELTRTIRERSPLLALTTDVALITGGTILLALLAQIKVPMFPVPVTGQSLGILLLGAGLGVSRGVGSVLAYLGLGAAGAPVFAGGIGLTALVGPTGGFLLSFIPAVAVVGFLCERGWDRSFRGALVTFFAGHAVIFVIGVAWLATLIGIDEAIMAGLVPFLPGMLIKTLIATLLLPLLWELSPLRKNANESDRA